MPYETLLVRLMEFTIRAAIAKSADESVWEHERLRKRGISALQIRYTTGETIQPRDVLDPAFYARLDCDLRARWRRLGYQTESLRDDMKALFLELENDASQAITDARGRFLTDFFRALQEIR